MGKLWPNITRGDKLVCNFDTGMVKEAQTSTQEIVKGVGRKVELYLQACRRRDKQCGLQIQPAAKSTSLVKSEVRRGRHRPFVAHQRTRCKKRRWRIPQYSVHNGRTAFLL